MRLTSTRSAPRRRHRSAQARSAVALLAALALALTGAAVAVAAVARPTLVKPANHGRVHANKIKLIVKDASPLAKKYGVFVSISRSRKRKADGALEHTSDVNKGESFVKLKQLSGHPGLWVYKPQKYSFSGYWASTAGRYYWQAEHTDCEVKGCEAVSRIGTFKVTG